MAIWTQKEAGTIRRSFGRLLDLFTVRKKLREEEVALDKLEHFNHRKLVAILQRTGLFHHSFANDIIQLQASLQEWAGLEQKKGRMVLSEQLGLRPSVGKRIEQDIQGTATRLLRHLHAARVIIQVQLRFLEGPLKLEGQQPRIMKDIQRQLAEEHLTELEAEDAQRYTEISQLVAQDLKDIQSLLMYLDQLFKNTQKQTGELQTFISFLERVSREKSYPTELRKEFQETVSHSVSRLNSIKDLVIRAQTKLMENEKQAHQHVRERERYFKQLLGEMQAEAQQQRRAAVA